MTSTRSTRTTQTTSRMSNGSDDSDEQVEISSGGDLTHDFFWGETEVFYQEHWTWDLDEDIPCHFLYFWQLLNG